MAHLMAILEEFLSLRISIVDCLEKEEEVGGLSNNSVEVPVSIDKNFILRLSIICVTFLDFWCI